MLQLGMLFLLILITSLRIIVYEVPTDIFLLYVPTNDVLSKLINCKLQIGLQFFTQFSNFEKM